MAKIDPGLLRLADLAALDEQDAGELAPAAGAVAVRHPNVMIELDSAAEPPELARLGFVRQTRAGNVLTGSIPRASIKELEHVPGLKRAEAARVLKGELDVALPDANVVVVHRPPQSLRGVNVLVGIVDSGIDYQHRSFRDRNGRTRIHSLWDQAGRIAGRERPPAGFTYGVEYTREEIDRALETRRPLEIVPHQDLAPFHGTHIAGIAAGNGQPRDRSTAADLVGVAPEADLIVVANTRPSPEDPGTMGDSADTLDAIDYILGVAKAAGKPVAINLSQGDNIGPHDGTSLLELGITALITSRCGRVLIKSAGNEGSIRHHAEGTLVREVEAAIPLNVPPPPAGASKKQMEVVIDTWAPSLAALEIDTPIPGAPPIEAVPGFAGTVTLSNGNKVFIAIESADPANGLARAFIVLQAGTAVEVATGRWTIRLQGQGEWHSWIQRDSGAEFLAHTSAGTTISIPGTSSAVVSVGSYITKGLEDPGTLAQSSSRGPTRDGRRAPTLAAPGEEIRAPQPRADSRGKHVDSFMALRGTSMAAGMVTGAAALMLSVDPKLTADEIRGCLERSAASGPHTGTLPNDAFGAGRLDVAQAIAEVRRLPNDRPPCDARPVTP